MRQHLTHMGYTKKQITWKDKMISVTIYYLWFKCYLNFYKIVAGGMRGIPFIARAMANKYAVFLKKYKNYKSNFSILTEVSLVSSSTVKIHFTLSPLDSPSLSTISLGIVTLNEPDWRLA